MHPDQPPIHWGGTIMWRGVTRAKAARTGSTFLGLGTEDRRLVIYPISQPDENGLSLINWIAEIRNVSEEDWQKTGWFSEVAITDFLHYFTDMKYDWLDVPGPAYPRAHGGLRKPHDRPRPESSTWASGPALRAGGRRPPHVSHGLQRGASQAIVDARNHRGQHCSSADLAADGAERRLTRPSTVRSTTWCCAIAATVPFGLLGVGGGALRRRV